MSICELCFLGEIPVLSIHKYWGWYFCSSFFIDVFAKCQKYFFVATSMFFIQVQWSVGILWSRRPQCQESPRQPWSWFLPSRPVVRRAPARRTSTAPPSSIVPLTRSATSWTPGSCLYLWPWRSRQLVRIILVSGCLCFRYRSISFKFTSIIVTFTNTFILR